MFVSTSGRKVSVAGFFLGFREVQSQPANAATKPLNGSGPPPFTPPWGDLVPQSLTKAQMAEACLAKFRPVFAKPAYLSGERRSVPSAHNNAREHDIFPDQPSYSTQSILPKTHAQI